MAAVQSRNTTEYKAFCLFPQMSLNSYILRSQPLLYMKTLIFQEKSAVTDESGVRRFLRITKEMHKGP